ncbi:MAG TPA: hypothetical protein VGI10_07330 [Polyangiaceae bacterium]|jgi:hypothetical protein
MKTRRARPLLGARSFVAFALCGFALLAPRVAHANGRFPNAEQLRVSPTGSLVVAGTYGLLVSGNSTDFQYVCESSLFGTTLMGSWVDPLLEVLDDGTILSGSLNGLRVSRDDGCTFASDWSLPHNLTFIPPDPNASGPAGKIVDLCPAYDAAHGVIALASVNKDDGTVLEHRLYHTVDGAKTWSQLGMAIPTTMVRQVFTVDVAPSDPNRIYVSGNTTGTSQLLTSTDGGMSFTASPVTLDDNDGVLGLYIAAVSPSDPKRVYLRANRRTDTDQGTTTWDDSLIVTDDGGMTATDVLRKQAALLGFALSPDGTTVLAGYGDPRVPPEVTTPEDLGLYSANSSDLTFSAQLPQLAVSCLRWTSDALYACATESDPTGIDPNAHDFHVARYTGTSLPTALTDFTPLVKLRDVRGPLPNASGQPSGCQAEWSTGDPTNPTQMSVCATFNACTLSGSVPLSAGSITCAASAGGASSGGASGGQGGNAQGGNAQAGSAGTGVGGIAGATPPSSAASNKSGCSCRAAARGDESLMLGGFLLGALGLVRITRQARKKHAS